MEGSSSFGSQKSDPQREYRSLLTECLPGHSALEPTILLNTVFLNSLGAQGYTCSVETESGTGRVQGDYLNQPAMCRQTLRPRDGKRPQLSHGQWQTPSLLSPCTGPAFSPRLPPKNRELAQAQSMASVKGAAQGPPTWISEVERLQIRSLGVPRSELPAVPSQPLIWVSPPQNGL